VTRRGPRSPWEWTLGALWALYLIMWIGGVGSYLLLGGVRAGDEWTAPLFLALAGLIVLVSAGPARGAALAAAGLAGFAIEWVGLEGGWLFGAYVYTDVLSPKLLGVPLVMISAWLVLAAYVHDRVRVPGWPVAAGIAFGAALLTAIDLVIDPLAAGPLQYWRWADGGAFYGVPAHNFAGWFVAGAIVLSVLRFLAGPARERVPAAAPVGWSIVLFFTILAAGHRLWVPALIGAALCAWPVLETRRARIA
jgi:bisanhydrobacterioruberin hydratase